MKKFDKVKIHRNEQYAEKNGGRNNHRAHIETHIQGLSYPCNQCGTVDRTSATSRMHSKSNHNKNHISNCITCTLCTFP